MKKFFVMLFSLVMLFAFISCDNSTQTPQAVYLGTGTMGGVQFTNDESLTLTTENGKDYKVEGTLSKMSAEQATAFGWADYPDSSYIVFHVSSISESNPVVVQGWVNSIDSEGYKDSKNGSTKTGKILALTQGETIREDLAGCYIWKCELKDGSIYTVDLTAQAESFIQQ